MYNETRRLTRSQSNRRIAGVCGGLAEYFMIDSTVIRLLFALSILLASFGFWAYIICWIVIPDESRLRQ